MTWKVKTGHLNLALTNRQQQQEKKPRLTAGMEAL
jgi:hypothetical protein